MEAYNPNLLDGNIITTRVRLARNLKGYPFSVSEAASAREIVKKVNRALVKADTFNLYYMSNLSEITLEAMKEKHLISQNLINNRECGAVLINQDQSVAIMVNEEDVIREQCFMKGLRLTEAYKRLDRIDDELSQTLDMAFDKRYGYLTACPTNLGTGLRASVMLFLPALTESGKMGSIIEKVESLGLTVRGIYGEGSKAEGYTYQISNEVTLGVSEYDILNSVEETVMSVCEAERQMLEKYYSKIELATMDRCRRAFGVLTNCVLLPYSEFFELIASVKLGVMLGILNISNISEIDDLAVSVRPANLCERYGKKLTATDRDLFRAEVVSRLLKKLSE